MNIGGLIEVKLAELLGVEWKRYRIDSGRVAAVEFSTIELVKEKLGGEIVPSAIENVAICVNEYWVNTEHLNSVILNVTAEESHYLESIEARAEYASEDDVINAIKDKIGDSDESEDESADEQAQQTESEENQSESESSDDAPEDDDSQPQSDIDVLADKLKRDLPDYTDHRFLAEFTSARPEYAIEVYKSADRKTEFIALVNKGNKKSYSNSLSNIADFDKSIVIVSENTVWGDALEHHVKLAHYSENGDTKQVREPECSFHCVTNLERLNTGDVKTGHVPMSQDEVTGIEDPQINNRVLSGEWTIEKCGDYALFVANGSLNTFKLAYDMDNDGIMDHFIRVMNGESIKYERDIVGEAFQETGITRKAESGRYVDISRSDYGRSDVHLFDKLSSILDKNIIWTSSGDATSSMSRDRIGCRKDSVFEIISKDTLFLCYNYKSNTRETIDNAIIYGDNYQSVSSHHVNSGSRRDVDLLFIDTITGVVFAQVKGNVLSFNVSNPSSKMIEAIIFRLEENRKAEEIFEYDSNVYGDTRSETVDKFSKRYSADVTSVLDRLEKDYASGKSELADLQERLYNLANKVNGLRVACEAFDADKAKKDAESNAIKQFEKIEKMLDVSHIMYFDNKLHVYTKDIYVQDPRSEKWHDIGTFDIAIKRSSEYNVRNTVIITNTKHNVSGYDNKMQAPHVFHGGNMCHGSWENEIVEAYSKGDMFGVIFLVIKSLKSVNTSDDAGRHITRWPEVSEDVARAPKGSTSGTDRYGASTNPHESALKEFLSAL